MSTATDRGRHEWGVKSRTGENLQPFQGASDCPFIRSTCYVPSMTARRLPYIVVCFCLVGFLPTARASSVGPPSIDGSMTVLHGRASSTAVASIVGTDATGPGYVQVLPCGTAPGASSNLNIDHAGQTVAGLAFVRFDATGTACLYNERATHLLVDIQGYMADNAFDDTVDTRILDTRQNSCAGTFITSTNATLSQVSRPPGDQTPLWPSVQLPDYDPVFQNGAVLVTSGCHVFYIQETYPASKLIDISFNQDGEQSITRLPIPPVLYGASAPTLAGISQDGKRVFVSGFEFSANPRVFGDAIWQIPLDGSPPSRWFFPGTNQGKTVFAVSADERYVYGAGLVSPVREYDRLLNTERDLPTPGSTLNVAFHPTVLLSSDGSKLCRGLVGGNSYLSIPQGAVIPLPHPCMGFTSSGLILTYLATDSAADPIRIATMNPQDLSATPVDVATFPSGSWTGVVLGG
jgi:hypothetical protein